MSIETQDEAGVGGHPGSDVDSVLDSVVAEQEEVFLARQPTSRGSSSKERGVRSRVA